MDKIYTGVIIAFVWFGIVGVAVLHAIYKLIKDSKNNVNIKIKK